MLRAQCNDLPRPRMTLWRCEAARRGSIGEISEWRKMMSRTALAVAIAVLATSSHAADTRRAPFAQPWTAAADLEVAAGTFHSPFGQFDIFSTTGRVNVPLHSTMN